MSAPCACKESARLRDRIAELEELLGLSEAPPVVKPRRIGVMLALFARREMVSRAAARAAFASEDMSDRHVDVYVSGARAWLRREGLSLKVEYGCGWYLSAADRASLRRRLADLRGVTV